MSNSYFCGNKNLNMRICVSTIVNKAYVSILYAKIAAHICDDRIWKIKQDTIRWRGRFHITFFQIRFLEANDLTSILVGELTLNRLSGCSLSDLPS